MLNSLNSSANLQRALMVISQWVLARRVVSVISTKYRDTPLLRTFLCFALPVPIILSTNIAQSILNHSYIKLSP